MNTEPKKILVVDDHPLTRKGLCDAIQAQTDLNLCGEAESIAEATAAIRSTSPDLVVLDLNLKDGNGWSLIEELTKTGELPPTLVLSVSDEQIYASRLLRAGARGYLMKDSSIAEVLAAFRKILSGHIALSDDMATSLLNRQTQPEKYSIDALSDRELQVFEMIAKGNSNKQIAGQLSVSEKTIGTYKARLMEKLGIRTTSQLIAIAAVKLSTSQTSYMSDQADLV